MPMIEKIEKIKNMQFSELPHVKLLERELREQFVL